MFRVLGAVIPRDRHGATTGDSCVCTGAGTHHRPSGKWVSIPETARKRDKASVADHTPAPSAFELMAHFEFVGFPTRLGAVRPAIANEAHVHRDSARMAVGRE